MMIELLVGIGIFAVAYVSFLWLVLRPTPPERVAARPQPILAVLGFTADAQQSCLYADMLRSSTGILGSSFVTSTPESLVFFDADQWLQVPEQRRWTVQWVASQIRELRDGGTVVDRLAFVEKDAGAVGLLPIQYQIADSAGLEACTVRLRRWPYLGNPAIKGSVPEPGHNVVLISDVTTDGGHIERAIDLLTSSAWKSNVAAAVVLYNCDGEDVEKTLGSRGVRLVTSSRVHAFVEREKDRKRRTADLEARGENEVTGSELAG